jgi:cell division protein YceG involved in septum cleavage
MAPSENTESDPGSSTPTTETSQAAKPESENINVITAKEISFIVPSGMLASKIIQKLEDEGLIDDRAAFTKRLSERKLDSKLRSGTFQLSTDMTYDQIINKLTGQ